jgi:2-oxoglutarate dehydrogenase E2 component (dihydrolipoamide succinyltransferase)
MALEVKMPKLGESVVEGTIGAWRKQVGDAVEEFEPLLEVITDKVETEVPSPASGVVLEIRVQEGETVPVGQVIAVIGTAAEAPEAAQPIEQDLPLSGLPAQPSAEARESGPDERPSGWSYHTPVVARIAAAHGVDLSQVPGTGRQGRITKKDILAYLERQEAGEVPAPVPLAPPSAGPETLPPPGTRDEQVPLSRMRQAIIHHMRQSKDTAAHVTTFWEADLSRVVAFRAAHKAQFAAEGINLTYLPFFVEAAVAGLKAYPMLNAVLVEDKLVYKRDIHIGIAVDLGEEGLIVPVIRDADQKSLRGLATAIADLAGRARAGTLQPDEVQGGTFTLTNHGAIGSLAATPIIPMPQVGILGVGAIQKRPVVLESEEGEAIGIRPMVYLSLSFDHRVVDGATADRFMASAKAHLEKVGT